MFLVKGCSSSRASLRDVHTTGNSHYFQTSIYQCAICSLLGQPVTELNYKLPFHVILAVQFLETPQGKGVF